MDEKKTTKKGKNNESHTFTIKISMINCIYYRLRQFQYTSLFGDISGFHSFEALNDNLEV